MKFDIVFHFPNSSVSLFGVDEKTKEEYARHMEFEVPFTVTDPPNESPWGGKPHTYIINPNLVTYVQIAEAKTVHF